ncbi:MAG: cupredoxin domain-containing protein, partial [Nitrososphaera sp.]
MKSRHQAVLLVAILLASALSVEYLATPSWAQDSTAHVSVVPGSSSLTTDAFQPNPVEVNVGETVVWTNDDSTVHTVTSGSAGMPDGEFDSSPNFNPLLNPGQTFSHTFEEAGEYPYFCALHPNMAGTVVVVGQEQEPRVAQGNVLQNQTTANNTTVPTLEEARQLYLSAWNNTDFNATFSTFIEENSALGYGVYEEHEPNSVFRPGETMMLYVELVGFRHMPIIDDQGNTMYFMNMTADYIISDEQGNELQRIPDVPAGNIISHRQNTELFLELTLTQTTPFPEGDYVITYIVHDNLSGESFELRKNVRVVDGSLAAESSTEDPRADTGGNFFDDALDALEENLDNGSSGSSDRDSGSSSSSGPSSSQQEEEARADKEEQENDCD